MNDPLKYFKGEDLIFWSFRYFLGRQTAATIDFAERLEKAWDSISEVNRNMIASELESAFALDDEDRSLGFDPKHLGDDMDRAAWEKVRAKYKGGAR